MIDEIQYVADVRRTLLKANRLIPQTLVDGVLLDYLLENDGTAKENSKELLNDLVAAHATKILFSDSPFFYAPRLSEQGQVRIGKVLQGESAFEDFSLSVDDLQHAGIFAATYSGKTTLLATILTQLTELTQPIPWMAFDFKRDLRGLSRKYDVKVLRWNWLKLNPLQPPLGVEPVQWMTFLADIMAHVFGWFHASENYLMQFMQQAYNSKSGYPTFRELHDLVVVNEETGRRFSEYREVVINRLASMLIVLKDVLDTETSFPIERLLEDNCVIELDGCRRDEANYLVEFFLAWIFSYRLAQSQRGTISHLLVFDEASRFFFKGRQFRETTTELGIPFIDTVPQIIRDYKEGLVCAAQEPSLMTHSLMSNLRTKFVGYLSEGEDIEAISDSLNLDDEEREELAKIGERGVWLVKRAGSKPFLVKSDDFPIPKDMSDQELQERMKGFVSQLDEVRSRAQVTRTNVVVETPRVLTPQLSSDAWDLLVNVCGHPFMGIRSRCYSLKISGRRIEAAINELADSKLIASMAIPLGRFRPVKFLIPTDEALNLLGNVGHDTSLWKKIGNTGFEHSLFQVLLAYAFRKKGCEAVIEKTLASRRRLDLFVIDGKRKMGIEIELTTTNVEEKMEGIDELDELVILVKEERMLQDALNVLKTHPANKKIIVKKASEFLSENSIKNSSGTSGTKSPRAEQT